MVVIVLSNAKQIISGFEIRQRVVASLERRRAD
jgi:hypothetical protein